MNAPTHTPRVVIAGAGFAGIQAARALAGSPVDVTVVDRRNFSVFQPLLYQVATGMLSPGEIATPIRSLLRRQRNARVVLADIRDIDVAGRRILAGTGPIPYDHLIVATGARTSYFGQDSWERDAPGLKTVEDALDIRRRVLLAFEHAEAIEDDAERRALLTFVVVGAGPTGVELAGQVAEMAHTTLRRDFRRIDPAAATVLLADAGDRVLPQFAEPLSAKAARSLERIGVTVALERRVMAIGPDAAVLEGPAGTDVIRARTVIWAAGVAASGLGAVLARRTGVETDGGGRPVVASDLTIAGHPEIRVVGDLAHTADPQTGKALPGVAQVAIQQGRYAGRAVAFAVAGSRPPGPFRYRDPGTVATIGRNRAVADVHGIRLSGYPAWLLWAGLHITFLAGHLNRAVVLTRWAWSYLLRARGGRLITGSPPRAEAAQPPAAAPGRGGE